MGHVVAHAHVVAWAFIYIYIRIYIYVQNQTNLSSSSSSSSHLYSSRLYHLRSSQVLETVSIVVTFCPAPGSRTPASFRSALWTARAAKVAGSVPTAWQRFRQLCLFHIQRAETWSSPRLTSKGPHKLHQVSYLHFMNTKC